MTMTLLEQPAAAVRDWALHLEPLTAKSPGRARAWVRDELADAGLAAETIDAAQLILSELVTNALLHADPAAGAEVAMHLTGGQLALSVTDTPRPTGMPRVRRPAGEGSRGMILVTAHAHVTNGDTGTRHTVTRHTVTAALVCGGAR
jgi:anti-sigma regulatory factor (Ser/Thr protein kinase)